MSATDQKEAVLAGRFGVKEALKGITGKMVSYIRVSDIPYRMTFGLEDVNKICNQEKTVPLEWISKDGSDVTDAFLTYALPLIQGTVEIPLGTDGLPDFISRK